MHLQRLLPGRLRRRLSFGAPYSVDDFTPSLSIRLLVLQPTPFCNIRCSYCYLPDRDSKHRMSAEVVRATIRNVVDCELLGPTLSAIWHAGEPLAAPVSFYRTAFADIQRVVDDASTVQHSIQTNATLIDDEWCDLFQEWHVNVGVSVDGPASIHDRHRRTRTGKGTHAKVMQGIDRLHARGIPFHAIAVVTGGGLEQPDSIFDFFAELGVREVGFNVDEAEGVNSSSSLHGENARHRRFLARMLQLALAHPQPPMIRELELARHSIVTESECYRFRGRTLPVNAQVIPFAITSVDWAGNFSTFSPELLGQRSAEFADFALGNVLRDRLTDALATPTFAHLYATVLAGVFECQRTCQYFSLCGGGAPANKFYENGSISSTETDYCRQMIQTPIDLALDQYERTERIVGSPAASS